jgi:hypothetical protein
MHVIATTTFVLGPLDDHGSRVRVSEVDVGQSDGRDPKFVFGVVQHPGRDENGSSR